MNEPVRKQVKSINFSLISPEEIKKIGVTKVVTPELYDVDGYPVDGGLMDLRMGAIDPGVRCRTCGGKLKECPGHFGFIELARSIIHLKYVPYIEMLLRCTCRECGKVLLSEDNLKKYAKPMIFKKAKDAKKCPYCQSEQDKIKIDKPTTFNAGKKRIFPSEIRARLSKISDKDSEILGFGNGIRPEWMVLTLLLVPPVTVRPSITLETSERSEDDWTHKLSDIVRANQRLWENLNAGAPEVIIEDLWDLLQYHITTFFDNSVAQVPPSRHRSGQPLETITERIKGKEGRIRHNLAGKRVNFSSRTVISPDPQIRLNEVGIPTEIAKVLTVPEKVTSENIEMLKQLVSAGDNYPGANYLVRPDGKRKKITEDLKEELLLEIETGYIVERHLRENDIVLFNRHPSLHRLSLMSHYVRILDGKTFRLHPGTANPYNADFDGDEMNVHVPQDEEARAESKILLDVKQNLMSPKDNSTELGCIADAITGNYLLCSATLPKEEAIQLLIKIGINPEEIPAEKMKDVIEGKEIFSILLPKVDFQIKTKACKGKECPYFDSCKKDKCPYNDYLKISEGKLISGVLDENSIGVEKGILIKELDKQVGRNKTFDVLDKMFSLGTAYLSSKGFTINLRDVDIDKGAEITNEAISKAKKEVEKIIGDYYSNTLELLPGKSREETREIKILKVLNNIRTNIGDHVKKNIDPNNSAHMMILSGARGNILNITQMACSVGQQSLWAKRIEMGYSHRTMSFFKRDDLSSEARGFVKSGYLHGLSPDEFFFGAITGRDSLMDVALRTPKSGYLYRRMANALQDLKVEYDGTVRDASGRIIQFSYGGDGKDPTRLHLNNPKISAGEAVGIITAESFGEPATQMTLNVFHFAGISEMQVSVGLPRLMEIFDARKKPSTPSMEIFFKSDFNNEKYAKEFAERIKEVSLEDLSKEIKILFIENKIEFILDKESLRDYHIKPETILKQLAEKGVKARIKEDSIVINVNEGKFKDLYNTKEKLRAMTISGVKGIEQVLVVKRDNDFVILTAGSNLEDILKLKGGINQDKIVTNDIHEMTNHFGIEVARQSIINETKKVITQQGLDIDERHIYLIADAMTNSGSIKGITRVGIISEKSSILAKASFETPIKHFVEASIKRSKDDLKSVIENVILNQAVPIGTGLPGLMVEITGNLGEKQKKSKK